MFLSSMSTSNYAMPFTAILMSSNTNINIRRIGLDKISLQYLVFRLYSIPIKNNIIYILNMLKLFPFTRLFNQHIIYYFLVS